MANDPTQSAKAAAGRARPARAIAERQAEPGVQSAARDEGTARPAAPQARPRQRRGRPGALGQPEPASCSRTASSPPSSTPRPIGSGARAPRRSASCSATAIRTGRRSARSRRSVNERRLREACSPGSATDQQLACVDLILDLRPSWARRAVLGLPLTDADEEERGHLLSGLDRLAGDGAGKERSEISST